MDRALEPGGRINAFSLKCLLSGYFITATGEDTEVTWKRSFENSAITVHLITKDSLTHCIGINFLFNFDVIPVHGDSVENAWLGVMKGTGSHR